MRKREDILHDIIEKGKKDPKDWKSSLSYDNKLNAMDYTFLHPEHGIYKIKEWQKNPYTVIGIGDHITRKIDDDVFKNPIGNFGIVRFNPKKIDNLPEEELSLSLLAKKGIITLELEG